MYSVLFICHGNICRSPMAEAMFRKKIEDSNIEDVFVDSAGIISFHKDASAHSGTISILKEYGIPANGLISRPVEEKDFSKFNLIIAMDRENIINLQRKAPKVHSAEIRLLSDFVGDSWVDVPDPWYTGDFNLVYQMIDKAIDNILLECTLKNRKDVY